MFGVGWTEMLLIGVVALVVIGYFTLWRPPAA